jgi:hypothetical protein
MSGRIEGSRRRGPFDSRWPNRRFRVGAALPAGAENVPDGLDWAAFSSHYFPGRRRHDLEVISAYDAYKHRRLGRKASRPTPRRRSITLNQPILRVEAKRHHGTAAGRTPRVG